MKKIILDTNFLLIPGQFMVDIFSEIEQLMNEPHILVVLDKSVNELLKLADGKSRDARSAQLGLALVNAKRAANPTFWEKLIGLVPADQNSKLKIVKAGAGYVDAAILKLADKDTLVATQDKKLKHKLKSKKIGVLTLVGKKHVKLV